MESAEIVYLDTEEKYLNISIERNKDNNISEQAKKLLKDYYQRIITNVIDTNKTM